MLKRMWVNQPSTQQICHKLHGTNVLADLSGDRPVALIYFISGDVISQEIPRICLSEGWLNK